MSRLSTTEVCRFWFCFWVLRRSAADLSTNLESIIGIFLQNIFHICLISGTIELFETVSSQRSTVLLLNANSWYNFLRLARGRMQMAEFSVADDTREQHLEHAWVRSNETSYFCNTSGNDRRYADVPKADIPLTESLKLTEARVLVIDFWAWTWHSCLLSLPWRSANSWAWVSRGPWKRGSRTGGGWVGGWVGGWLLNGNIWRHLIWKGTSLNQIQMTPSPAAINTFVEIAYMRNTTKRRADTARV